MAKLVNLACMTTPTTGDGPITLGAAVAGHLTFAEAGLHDGDSITYAIIDGAGAEMGRGVYRIAGPSLTRSVIQSTNNGQPISLSGAAQVYISELGGGAGGTATAVASSEPPKEGPGINMVGQQVGIGMDSILRAHADGSPASEYTSNEAGLTAALADAAAGEIIHLPAGVIDGDHTLKAGVAVVGLGENSQLSGMITGAESGTAYLAQVKLTGMLALGAGEVQAWGCDVAQAQSGIGYFRMLGGRLGTGGKRCAGGG